MTENVVLSSIQKNRDAHYFTIGSPYREQKGAMGEAADEMNYPAASIGEFSSIKV